MFYIVATPIGNLKDITIRAVETLKSVDLVLAEDTRRTQILLNEYGIKAKTDSYQKFNERAKTQKVIELLKDGKNIALVSDAGMPLISDPGSVLLNEIINEKLEYTVISGPCAAVSGAVLSGLDLSQFCFVGFLPEKNSDKNTLMDKFCNLECTLVFYVSPHSVIKDLEFLFSRLGERKAVLTREISKLHEQVTRFTLGEIPDCNLKGEMVLVVSGAQKAENELNLLSVAEHVEFYIKAGADKMDAIKKTAADRGVAKNVIYKEVNK